MPLPVAHGLIGASIVAALLPLSRSRIAKPLLLGAVLGISPDLDYALNWFRISGGGWHHGFTHSIPFAFVVGLYSDCVLCGVFNRITEFNRTKLLLNSCKSCPKGDPENSQ